MARSSSQKASVEISPVKTTVKPIRISLISRFFATVKTTYRLEFIELRLQHEHICDSG